MLFDRDLRRLALVASGRVFRPPDAEAFFLIFLLGFFLALFLLFFLRLPPSNFRFFRAIAIPNHTQNFSWQA